MDGKKDYNMFQNKVKCVIWDLDDTIWDGSLVERDNVVLRENIADLIKRLDQNGIINSICSKNNYHEAKAILEKTGIWEYFVFSVIDFVPKGQSVKGIIDNLQLRPDNVLFVDDNIGNRNEVQYYCNNIMTADANDKDFIENMEHLVRQAEGKSRLEQYKILENKINAQKEICRQYRFFSG